MWRALENHPGGVQIKVAPLIPKQALLVSHSSITVSNPNSPPPPLWANTVGFIGPQHVHLFIIFHLPGVIVSQELSFLFKPRVHVFVAFEHNGLVKALGESFEEGTQLFSSVLGANTQL